uniref:Alpha 1 protein n=1 Tax=Hefer Valley virus TaxID=3035973 RepID=A0AA49ETH3_9RHAB|nr:alpha 1 protein [Hefer Valley virus]
MDGPFRKLWNDIRQWGEKRGEEINAWWIDLEWRLKIIGIILLLLIGSLVIYKVGKIVTRVIICFVKGGKKVKNWVRRKGTKRKKAPWFKVKNRNKVHNGGKKKAHPFRNNLYQSWEETKMCGEESCP